MQGMILGVVCRIKPGFATSSQLSTLAASTTSDLRNSVIARLSYLHIKIYNTAVCNPV